MVDILQDIVTRVMEMTTAKFNFVDFHAHILPGADHGCMSVDDALYQLKLAASRGIKRIIAAPHFYPQVHHVSGFISRRNQAFDELSLHMTPDMPKIVLGAEALICDGIEEMPDLDRLFIEGTRTLLLELPMNTYSYKYTESVEQMTSMGIDVVIAHAERYMPKNINQLIEVGARLQLNASALDSLFLSKHIRGWILDGKVVAVGSDIHGRDKKAYASFMRAVSKRAALMEHIRTESDKIWEKAIRSYQSE